MTNSARKPKASQSRNGDRPRTTQSQAKPSTRQTKQRPTPTFEIDAELLEPSYNQSRKPRLPYGIVVNDNPAGIIIPIDQLEAAGWLDMPNEAELDTVTLGENDVMGLLVTEARLLILDFVPEYIRYKDENALAQHDADESLAQTFIGAYETHKHLLDKRTMEVCSEHALVFLDEDNQPLHTAPIVVRFKNVALWSLKSSCEEFYRQLEKAFAAYTGQKFSGKSNRWRSLGVLSIEFKGTKEGQGKNKSWCCKSVITQTPTPENLTELFLGTPQSKRVVWNLQDEIEGLVDTPIALPAAEGVTTDALSAATAPKAAIAPAKRATPQDLSLEDDDDFIEVDAEAIDDDLDETDVEGFDDDEFDDNDFEGDDK